MKKTKRVKKPKPSEGDKTIGEVLKHFREKRKIGQRTLERRSLVNQQTISAIERGTEEPNFLIVRRLAIALRVPLGHICKAIGTPQMGDMDAKDRRRRENKPVASAVESSS